MKKIFIAFLYLFISSISVALDYSAGVQKLVYNKTKIALWYPSQAKEQVVPYWEWKGYAAGNSAISKGLFPMIIFSHGMKGSIYNQYYLAEYLARNGYIVAAVEHDDKACCIFQTLVDRPTDIKKAITYILNDTKINTYIDSNKIGILGHSLGGYSSFVIGGGDPDLSNHISLSWLPTLFKRFYIKLRNFNNNFYDSRIKAIVALAPGLGILFNKDSLSKVNIPILIIEAEKDEVLLDGSLSLYKKNLSNNSNFIILKGAGHYSFLPVCNKFLNENFSEICNDPNSLREPLHEVIKIQVLSFFNKVFYKNK